MVLEDYSRAPDLLTDMSNDREMDAMWADLTAAVSDAWDAWDGAPDEVVCRHELAFLAFGSLTDHGYGLWDGRYEWGEAFHAVVCADSRLQSLATAVDEAFAPYYE